MCLLASSVYEFCLFFSLAFMVDFNDEGSQLPVVVFLSFPLSLFLAFSLPDTVRESTTNGSLKGG
jgi:hypothetical protein